VGARVGRPGAGEELAGHGDPVRAAVQREIGAGLQQRGHEPRAERADLTDDQGEQGHHRGLGEQGRAAPRHGLEGRVDRAETRPGPYIGDDLYRISRNPVGRLGSSMTGRILRIAVSPRPR
jgi:hypothetical protein